MKMIIQSQRLQPVLIFVRQPEEKYGSDCVDFEIHAIFAMNVL
ncbi:hypothetical protein V144x_36610 [Gimesia aquarii]|uniref:Uncharacterized protein n=1 Tax=Gimesia aquarii TaxID=2527964 RepID=A0A517VYS8_9PLAN|nr:hypothetical protein V144x_36610 [Gimesia aquarii]